MVRNCNFVVRNGKLWYETAMVRNGYGTKWLASHLLHLISIMSFKLGHVSIPIRRIFFRPCFCFVYTIVQFSRILRFSNIYCQIFCRVPFSDRSDVPLNSECITSTIGSEKFQTFIILAQYFEIMIKRKSSQI